jgi:hypothetical protein
LVVVAAVGMDMLGPSTVEDRADHLFSAERDHADDAPAPDHGGQAGPRLLATGNDYRTGQLPAAPAQVSTFGAPPASDQQDQPGITQEERDAADDPAAPVPPALQHLWPLPPACQSAIIAGYDHGATIEVVDFATVDGHPALVAWLTTDTGQRWVSVVGPGCGSTAVDADERHRAQVG